MLAKRAWLLVAGVVCAVYFYGLGSASLLGPDEPRYAQVAREMFERGDWVTPTLAGHHWFEKPALLYWLMSAAYGLFGVTEFAARASAALSGVLVVALVGWLARRVEFEAGEALRGFGVTCAAVAASSAGLLVFARGASFDILLTATVTASLACFLVSEIARREGRRRWPLAGFYAGVGASLLAKGLVGVVIPAGVVALYFIARRRPSGVLRLGLLWGPLLSLAVAAVWYAPVTARHGWEFVDEFFVQHHFARYASNKYHHPQPFYFYIPIMLMLALPWTAFALGGAASAVRETNWRAEDAASKLRVLALAWLVVPVAFFSLSGSKLPGYVLPALPGAALLAGERVLRYLRGEGGLAAMRVTGGLALALFAAGLAYAFRSLSPWGGAAAESGLSTGCVLAVVAPAGVCGVAALFFARRRALCVWALAGGTLLTVVLIAGCALGHASRRESVRDLLRLASERGHGALPVFQLHTVERSAEFYAAGRLAYDAAGEPLKFEGANQVADALRRSGGRGLVLVPTEFVGQLNREQGIEAEVLGDNGSVSLVFVKVGE